MGSGDRRVKVSFEDWELEVLWEVARKRGVSLTQLIKEAVRRMLEQEREREAVERMEALVEEYMLRTIRALEPLKDEVGLLGSGMQELKGKLSTVAQGLVAREREIEEMRKAVAKLEEAIGLLREEVSELRKRVSTVELSLKEGERREGGVVARKDSEAVHGHPHREAEAVVVGSEAVAAGLDADFQIPSFLKDNPWVEILSKKGRS